MTSLPCHEIDLAGFVQSQLDAGETSAVVQHLQECADCRDRLRLALELRENRDRFVRSAPAVSPRRKLHVWATATMLLLATLVAYRWMAPVPGAASLASASPYPLLPPQLRGPSRDDAFLEGARAYSRQDWEAAERAFRQLLARDPDDYDATFYLANLLYAQGRREESERQFLQLLQRRQDDGRVLWYLGNLRLLADDGAGARRYLESAVAGNGEFAGKAAAVLSRLTPGETSR